MNNILLVLAFSFINRHRGGGFPNIKKFLKEKFGIGFIRSLFTAMLFLFGVLYYITDDLIYSSAVSFAWMLWGLNGWGSYFDIGAWETGYRDKPEVAWIDWIVYKIFGPKWIPSKDIGIVRERSKVEWSKDNIDFPFPFSFGFAPPDVINSPIGEIRPIEWRRKRDTVAMFLRQMHSIYFFLILGYFSDNLYYSLMSVPFSVIITIIYSIVNRGWFKRIKLFNDQIAIAEYVIGILFAISIILINN